jgi:hypothetical protein
MLCEHVAHRGQMSYPHLVGPNMPTRVPLIFEHTTESCNVLSLLGVLISRHIFTVLTSRGVIPGHNKAGGIGIPRVSFWLA